MILSINPYNPQQRLIDQVVTKLRQGAVICYPTDTVYGIGCDFHNQKAVKRIFQIKHRPKNKPFSFICSSLKNVSTYCHVSNMGYRIMKKHLPGPYTFILPAMKIVPKIMVTKQKTVGIRVPDNQISLALVEALGNPIVTTSANVGEDDYAEDAYDIEEKMGKQIDIIIDGGPLYPIPSTVVSLDQEGCRVLRQGKGETDLF